MQNMNINYIFMAVVLIVMLIVVTIAIIKGGDVEASKRLIAKKSVKINEKRADFERLFDNFSDLREAYVKRIRIILFIALIAGLVLIFTVGKSSPFPYLIVIILVIMDSPIQAQL